MRICALCKLSCWIYLVGGISAADVTLLVDTAPHACQCFNRCLSAVQMSQGIVALSGAMEHISSQAPLPTYSASNPQQYFVELLDLGVRAV